MPNAWFRQFNNYHAIYSPYPRGNMSFDITIKLRVRAFENDQEKWDAFRAEYPDEEVYYDFYAYTIPVNTEANPPEFECWMDLRHYGAKGLFPPHVLGHEVLHALNMARAVQNEESFPASDMVDADQLTGLTDAIPPGDITSYTLSAVVPEGSGGSAAGGGMLDKSKRILGTAADWYSVTVLGSTNGPFTITINGIDYTIDGDVVVSGVTDLDEGALAAGTDYYVYACVVGGVIVFKVSAASDHPAGHTELSSYLLGGFHTFCEGAETLPYEWAASTPVWHGMVCVPVGATGYSAYKYVAQYQGTTGGSQPTWPTSVGATVVDGSTVWRCTEMGMCGRYAANVIPASIWDLTHRARCLNNAGMTYDEKTGLWVDIYLSSGAAGSIASVNGGTISLNKRWITAVTDGHSVGKRLLSDHEFQSAAEGVWEEAQTYETTTPLTTGGRGCLFLLELDSAPTPADFLVGQGQVTGASSGVSCQVLKKISSTVYLCRNLSSFGGFTDGEILSDGTNSRDCGAGYPHYTTTSMGRIVSNIGCEDIVGVYDQWLLDQGFFITGASYEAAKTFAETNLEDHRGALYAQSDAKLLAGGYHHDNYSAGSQRRKISIGRNTQDANVAVRYCCEEL